MQYAGPCSAERVGPTPKETPEVITHDFNGMALRVVQIDGEPWFVGADALMVIRGKTSGMGHAYDPLGDDEKTKVQRKLLGMQPGREVMLISESGLYKLITRSDKPEARPFQEWVTRDVLPAPRKTGT